MLGVAAAVVAVPEAMVTLAKLVPLKEVAL